MSSGIKALTHIKSEDEDRVLDLQAPVSLPCISLFYCQTRLTCKIDKDSDIEAAASCGRLFLWPAEAAPGIKAIFRRCHQSHQPQSR